MQTKLFNNGTEDAIYSLILNMCKYYTMLVFNSFYVVKHDY